MDKRGKGIMKLTLFRNATMIIEYAGTSFLVDPAFGKKGSRDPFPCELRPDERNPVAELPAEPEEITAMADAVIITHLHSDHFDGEAAEVLPKEMPVFVQDAADAEAVSGYGFTDVRDLSAEQEFGAGQSFGGIQMIKTPGRHGEFGMSEEALADLGNVCGVVMRSKQAGCGVDPEDCKIDPADCEAAAGCVEKTLYIAGDTVFYDDVAETIDAYSPDVIVVNAGANNLAGDRLVMDEADVLSVHEAAPGAVIVAVHMEAFNHWVLSREELKAFAEEKGFAEKIVIPEDGESIEC